MDRIMPGRIRSTFQRQFQGNPQVFRSPGRVNILGEHTDYNQGFVLPAAIDKAIFVAIEARADTIISLFATNLNEKFECQLEDVQSSGQQWANYILGVVDQLKKRGYQLHGFNLVVDGDIPIGAGLSSSAAVECAVIFALNAIFKLNLQKIEMVQLAQKAEHEYAGVMCGIMDQFTSMFGKANHVIKLDCRSLEYEYIPFSMSDVRIVLLNTNVRHNLASSEYNTRRMQCENGVELIREHIPEITSLRDVTSEMLDRYVKQHELVYQRCKYVIEENDRLQLACKDLQNGDLRSLGEKMFHTHEGLSKKYKVSCKELDFLVDIARSNPHVLGARMMGGGFGGCTINLVKEGETTAFTTLAKEVYEDEMKLPLSIYTASIADGASTV